jgi:uncharacterized protein YdcH (DUF465 family)
MSDAQLSQFDDVKNALLRKDEAFRRLVSEHHALDEHIRQLSGAPHPSDQQQLDEVALKKQKLALKDRIAAVVQRHALEDGTARAHPSF